MTSSGDATAREAMETARLELMECEKEIQSIKDSLKSLAVGSATEAASYNSLKIAVHKVKISGVDEDSSSSAAAVPSTFKIHLSSPIEERTIVQLHDPLDPTADGSYAIFESIETSNALLTIEAYSSEGAEESTKLGVSAAHDLLPLCQDLEKLMSSEIDGETKSLMVDFAIVAEGGVDKEKAVEDVKEESNKGGDVEEVEEGEIKETTTDGDEAEEGEKPAQDVTSDKVQVPMCILSVHLEYTPSPNDKRDSLYDKLNEVSKRKAAAIESLRKSAAAVNRAKTEASSGGTEKSSAAVKSGFLNKPTVGGKSGSSSPPPFWKRWYEKTIGPNAMLWVVGPVAKNYVIFLGVSVFIHYKGDLLALPPPV